MKFLSYVRTTLWDAAFRTKYHLEETCKELCITGLYVLSSTLKC